MTWSAYGGKAIRCDSEEEFHRIRLLYFPEVPLIAWRKEYSDAWI